jgi:cell division protein FtsB
VKILVPVLLSLLGLAQYQLWYGPGGILPLQALYEAKARQITENRRLQERNLALAADVADLQQGLEAIEERARSDMGMIKNGEVFYRIVQTQPR